MSNGLSACRGNRFASRTVIFSSTVKIVRKSLPEIRAMRMLVHDSRFQPQDANEFPRWQSSIRIA